MREINRRDLLKLASVGGVVLSTGLPAMARVRGPAPFYFLQLSDTHWGYTGASNPEAASTLEKTVATVNSVEAEPAFIVFTGDLTHTTDDAAVRNRRMAEFKAIVAKLRTRTVRFLPGEHDASLDAGAAYRDHFGATHYSFDHGGVHFVALDNVSDPKGTVGDAQIDWLRRDLRAVKHDAPLIILAHRPLFDLFPAWEWATPDGAKVVDLLLPYKHATVFYGHIHQEHHHQTEHIAHHAARSLIFPLPPPGSQPKRAPLPWDALHPFNGLGYRRIGSGAEDVTLIERPVVAA
ncbi:MAG TPA: metallophosphoesterase [Polyangia bacterium]|jgi:hypothetical protein|nr:metallophosphoesterase [Polyangia bacterium]